MRIIITLFLILTITPVMAVNSFCQVPDEKLSINEEREVRKLAEKFGEQLQVTRDITPFLNKPFARAILDKVLADTDGLVKPDVATKVSRDELRQFYFAMSNLGYLSDLYIYSKFSLEKNNIRDLLPQQQYPPEVVRLMRSNPTISKWWNQSDSDDAEKKVESVDQLRSLADTWQKAAFLMRKNFRRHPPERAITYQRNLLYLAPFLKKIRVDTCESEDDCAGFPLHTQTINVYLPVLQLLLVRKNGRLEILTVGIHGN